MRAGEDGERPAARAEARRCLAEAGTTHRPCTECLASHGCTWHCHPAVQRGLEGGPHASSRHGLLVELARGRLWIQRAEVPGRTAAPSMSARVTPAAMDTMSFLSVREADTCDEASNETNTR